MMRKERLKFVIMKIVKIKDKKRLFKLLNFETTLISS